MSDSIGASLSLSLSSPQVAGQIATILTDPSYGDAAANTEELQGALMRIVQSIKGEPGQSVVSRGDCAWEVVHGMNGVQSIKGEPGQSMASRVGRAWHAGGNREQSIGAERGEQGRVHPSASMGRAVPHTCMACQTGWMECRVWGADHHHHAYEAGAAHRYQPRCALVTLAAWLASSKCMASVGRQRRSAERTRRPLGGGDAGVATSSHQHPPSTTLLFEQLAPRLQLLFPPSPPSPQQLPYLQLIPRLPDPSKDKLKNSIVTIVSV